MITAWIGYAMLSAAAAGGGAACIERLLARRRYPRRALWIGAMTASVALPAVFSWNARPAPAAESVTARVSDGGALDARTRGASVDPDAIAIALWAAASLSAAAWLVFSQVRLHRTLRKCERVRVDDNAVIVSPDFGPAIVGVVRPEIVLPRWVLSLDDVDRRLVLAHEREHMRARDPAWQLTGLAIAVALPWNVALWWQLKRLRLAIEIDCDSRVIGRHHVHPVRYGELLVRAQCAAPAATSSALALVQHKSTLARRVDALLGLPGHTTTRIAASSALGIVVASLVAFVPAPPIRRAAPVRTAAEPTVGRTAAAAPVAVAQPVATSTRATSRPTRVRQLALPAVALPPVQFIPSTTSSAGDAVAPSVAPLPIRRFGTAVLVPRAAGGFRAAPSDSNAARAAGGGGRGGVIRAAVGGGGFARATRSDSTAGGVTATGTGASAGSDSSRGRAAGGLVAPASAAARPATRPPTP